MMKKMLAAGTLGVLIGYTIHEMPKSQMEKIKKQMKKKMYKAFRM